VEPPLDSLVGSYQARRPGWPEAGDQVGRDFGIAVDSAGNVVASNTFGGLVRVIVNGASVLE
jgi:hypothetical protein